MQSASITQYILLQLLKDSKHLCCIAQHLKPYQCDVACTFLPLAYHTLLQLINYTFAAVSSKTKSVPVGAVLQDNPSALALPHG